MSILSEFEARTPEYAAWRHSFHEHPELGLETVWTEEQVAGKLRSWGIDVTTGVGGHGVVGVLEGSLGPGRRIGLRSDMDALKITETGECPWKSKVEGLMHACGHDGHMTMLLAAAQYLAAHRDFKGTVVFIFQPGEENSAGAHAMIADGLFKRFPVDEIYGFHNWTDIPVGEVRCRRGPTMAGQDFFEIHVKGRGAHASAPQLSCDAALAAALITTAMQQIVARNVAPLDSAVVSVTTIHTGSANNIIPETAELTGCTRFFSEATGKFIRSRMETVAKAVAESVGCTAEVVFKAGAAVLVSEPHLADELLAAAKEALGEDKAAFAELPQMASEDFSFLAREVPGAFCFVGGQAPYGATNVHNPKFDFDDRSIAAGAALWVSIVRRRLGAD